MAIDQFLGSLSHPDWLASSPLGGHIARQYIEFLQRERYSELTIRHYLSALAHFNYWAGAKPLVVSPSRRDSNGRVYRSAFAHLCLPPSLLSGTS